MSLIDITLSRSIILGHPYSLQTSFPFKFSLSRGQGAKIEGSKAILIIR